MERCKKTFMRGFTRVQCSRTAAKDGFCKQHHPDNVKARNEKSHSKLIEKIKNSPYTKLHNLEAENAELRVKLAEYQTLCKKLYEANKVQDKKEWVSVIDKLQAMKGE